MTDIKNILKRNKERSIEFDNILKSPPKQDDAETLDSSTEYGIHKFVSKNSPAPPPPPPPPRASRVDKLKAEVVAENKENAPGQRRSGRVQSLRDRFELSSKTGQPLHPDDDILNVACDIVARRPVRPIGTASPLFNRSGSPLVNRSVVGPKADSIVSSSSTPIHSDAGNADSSNNSSMASFNVPPSSGDSVELPTHNVVDSLTPVVASYDNDFADSSAPVNATTVGDFADSSSLSCDVTQNSKLADTSAAAPPPPPPNGCHFVDSSTPLENRPITPYGEHLLATSFARKNRPITPNSEVLGSLLDDIYHDMEKFQKLNSTDSHAASNNAGDGSGELQHTISFYRRQTQNRCNSQDVESLPRRPSSFLDSGITHSPNSSHSSEIPSNDATLKRLQEALIVQQDHIYQASRALNYCRQQDHFRGSPEEVDAQRALLVATEKRRALISERDRVINARQCATEAESSEPHGTLAFSYIGVRLSRDYINMYIQQHSESRVYYFIVLIKHGEHVFHTSMVSSTSTSMKSGYIEFPQYISVSGLTSDFVVTLEVYGLRGTPTARPTEKKRKTIRKMVTTSLADSGAGSNSLALRGKQVGVLETGFQKLGYLTINRSHLAANRFLLSEVLYPLDGVVMLNLQCMAQNTVLEFRGFLSLYRIVSGLGAWTRFWCLLSNGRLSFWRYPEDEERKRDPVVALELEKCLSDVSAVSNSVASFPNSMQVDVASTASEGAPTEEIRMLFAADTNEEMLSWIEAINKAIHYAKIWT